MAQQRDLLPRAELLPLPRTCLRADPEDAEQSKAAPALPRFSHRAQRPVPGAEAPFLFAGSGLGQRRALRGSGGLVSALPLCHDGGCCLVAYSNSTVRPDLDDVDLTRI